MGRLCAFAFLLLFASPQASVKESLRMRMPTVKGNMTLSEQCHLILKLLGEHNILSDQFVHSGLSPLEWWKSCFQMSSIENIISIQ